MSNIKHKPCIMREAAKSARTRLMTKAYDSDEISAPKNITPQQRAIYLKLVKLSRAGEDVSDPVALFADSKKFATLSHEEKQRYVLTLCADFVQMKRYLEHKTAGAS